MSHGRTMIYADPITRRDPEGEAELLRVVVADDGLYHDQNGQPFKMARWLVRFDDGIVTERQIRTDVSRSPSR